MISYRHHVISLPSHRIDAIAPSRSGTIQSSCQGDDDHDDDLVLVAVVGVAALVVPPAA